MCERERVNEEDEEVSHSTAKIRSEKEMTSELTQQSQFFFQSCTLDFAI